MIEIHSQNNMDQSCFFTALSHNCKYNESMIKISVLDVKFLEDPRTFRTYFEQMPLYRREKISRIVPEKEKRLSLGAGILLKRALKACGLDDEYEIACGTDGKPYFPLISGCFRFSLSHSGSYALCVYDFDKEGRAVSVGCDIEKIRDADYPKMLKYFHPNEKEQVMCLEDPQERRNAFFRLWTLKESLIKADGRGMGLSLKDFCIDMSTDPPRASMPFDHYILREGKAPEGYMISWCYADIYDPQAI